MREYPLPGGFVNQVVRVGTTVRRPPPERAPFVRALLTWCAERGWSGAPPFLGVDEEGRDIVDYVDGEVAWRPEQRRAASTDETLVRVARLVREFHDLSRGSPWVGPGEVVCHNDLSPRNTVYTRRADGWYPRAFIDWDLAAPGAPVHDVAHVCWQFLELGPEIADPVDAGRRIRLIGDAYGLAASEDLVGTVLWWQDRCWRGIDAAADQGQPAMVRLRDQGTVDGIRAAYQWVSDHRSTLTRAR